jgi:hypothetical protein
VVLENRAVGVPITSRVSIEIAQRWPCYNPPHEAQAPKGNGERAPPNRARALWRNAPNLPTAAERVRALKQAALHASLTRALDENPDLGRDKLGSKAAKQD